ncbi:golgin subfamily A member 3-like [Argiope bruennichi]|uniref:golgin subfamily A member 3-like n=1 Tax=Argiope bruennichi TaxID=94029 RepID=UPI00249463D3|nr:golgin subfamily A member 3-like [Argiope bruennichi]
MAAFQFSVQQLSFQSDETSLNSSLDSLSSVVDPNVDFVTKNENYLDEKEIKDEWKSYSSLTTKENHIMENKQNPPPTSNKTPDLTTENELSNIKDLQSSYPTIPLAVAHYINQNNPDICQEAERYFNSDAFQSSSDLNSKNNMEENLSPTSPLHSMSIASEALALQHSVIGNFGVKPVSADIVAQVVANTKLRLQQGNLKVAPSADIESISKSSMKNDGGDIPKVSESAAKPELIRYPPEVISSTVEKHSWFSSTSSDINNEFSYKSQKRISDKHSSVLSKSSSQSSLNSLGHKKSHRTNETDLPKLHSSRKSNKNSKYNSTNIHSDYEFYPESSVDYETESSVSEKFEVESLCSEAFETESNFSEISGFDDDMLHFRRSSDISEDISKINFKRSSDRVTGKKLNSFEMKDSDNTAMKITANKATETDDSYNFQLLREKATLEGRLESVMQEQNDLIKEKEHYCSLATAYEAQLKSLQSQIDAINTEKKNALMMYDVQTKEHKNWDNVIKEYQSIIEAKNAEIKALKDDISESEQATTRAKINCEELKVDLESKDGAISGLKKKITELHVEVQILLQGKIQLENEVKNVRLEMDTLQKSKEWFQEQLYSAQDSRNKLHQQLISVQSNESLLSNNLEKILAERNQLKQELILTQQRAVAEKEVLMKQLETIEADMKERESLFDDIQKDKGSAEAVLVERIRKLEEEKSQLTNLSFTVSNQEHELKMLKSDCEEKSKHIQSLVKEKAELNKQLTVLQKSSSDKDLSIQQLMQQINDIKTKLNHSESDLRRAEDLISTLKAERTAADVALASANEEKRVVHESLKTVSENLNKFQSNFKHMKAELISQTSLAEQLLKEKKVLEETVRKNEESLLLLRKEFEQQTLSESQNRNVMYDDLRKKKSDVENVLNVYSKDLINYQQTVENLSKQKVKLESETDNLKKLLKEKDDKINLLTEENRDFVRKLEELENKFRNSSYISDKSDSLECTDGNLKEQMIEMQTPLEDQKQMLISKSKAFLCKKLKDKIKECKMLRAELETSKKICGFNENSSEAYYLDKIQGTDSLINGENKLSDLEAQLNEQKKLLEDKILQLKKSENIIIELEKEKGKAIGFSDKCNMLKQRLAEMETKLSEKDAYAAQLSCLVDELKGQLADLDSNSKLQISNFETDLNKEKALVKSLRQQIFHEKRANSHMQRDLVSLKSALEQANQIADSKKQEIITLQNELALKVQAELKHRAEIEYFQTEIRQQHNIVEKLNKELEEVKARDPALAEQIKALSWRLKEKTNEAAALQEKINLIEERHCGEVEGLKKNMQETEFLLEKLKKELDDTRKEKFNYQSKVIELRKALKSKLAELESKGILRVENKASSDGPIIHLNIPDPEVSFDEAYVNDLLQKSMHLSESRPLSNLQECLNSLKEEMNQLQKKIIDNSETT